MGLDMYILDEYRDGFAYLRKFNALHGYFDKKYKLGNPGHVQLDNETVNDIYNRLASIIENFDKAEELLPVYYGPYFGSYEYDDMYLYKAKEALKVFERLKEMDMNTNIHYYACDY
ncbi:hypothetical protein ACFPVV_07170 [Macrococcoides bohemicum]|uniref:Uncharacterized protein n=1 Tax=Macrococcoides bohemicum TaxID=1903056 RepID=A0A327ZZX5_9STAP|nr:hypothetical protein [Macrococcus bohemicus]RAK47637.1 hypothetical protein BHX94_12325 [Macrococcus bohemicus]